MNPLNPPPARLLSGQEPIAGAGATLVDFWAWALSDLRSNTTRPMLAEFLVARALSAAGLPRIEWNPHDVETDDGLRVEVKSGAYLPSWPQSKISDIRFGRLRSGILSAETNRASEADYNADVYVFALLGATEHDRYDALDTTSWDFWVASRAIISATKQTSLGLAGVRRLANGPISYDQLAEAVRKAAN